MVNAYYPNLFKKGHIGNVEIKNRIVRNSMGTYLGNPDGTVTDRQIKAYAEAADGGAGLVFMDNATPVPMASCGLRADLDTHIAGLSLLADAIKSHGAVPGMQLAHPGRDAGFVGSADVIGASAITFEPWYQAGAKLPRPLSIDEIHDLVHKFGDAALRCKRAGFEVVELHAAAGCIPTNFLSPHDNHRTDMYGGSLENRMRLLLEIIADMKQKCGPNFPIGVKLSTEDCEPEGIRIDETVQVAKAVEKAGVSHINLISGTHATAAMEILQPDGFNASMTKQIKDAVSIPVFAGHNVFTPELAEKMLSDGDGDFVALGRASLADPAWAKKAQNGLADDITPCINCLIGCTDRGLLANKPISCTVNPTLYKYECPPITPTQTPKNVVVIGGGPAGCEAALATARRGNHVTLYEKREIGGAMIEASAPENKADIRRLIAYYKRHLDNNKNIDVVQKNVTTEDILNENCDAAIVAVGGRERTLNNVNGINSDIVFSAMSVLTHDVNVPGESVAVIGGGITGSETALELARMGKKVTIVEMADQFLSNQSTSSAAQAYAVAISQSTIKVLTSLRLEKVADGQLTLVDKFGNEQLLKTDAVVLAAGFDAQPQFANTLDDNANIPVYNVGDAKRVRDIYDAVHEGFVAGRQI